MLLVALGNLLIIASVLTERPVSTVLAVAALLLIVPQAVRGLRAWRRTRQEIQ
jgi:hypothetical protein